MQFCFEWNDTNIRDDYFNATRTLNNFLLLSIVTRLFLMICNLQVNIVTFTHLYFKGRIIAQFKHSNGWIGN